MIRVCFVDMEVAKPSTKTNLRECVSILVDISSENDEHSCFSMLRGEVDPTLAEDPKTSCRDIIMLRQTFSKASCRNIVLLDKP